MEKALEIYGQDTFEFNGDKIVVVVGPSEESWIAVKPLCDNLGIQSHRQIERLKDDPRFSGTPMYSTGSDGKTYEMFCIPACKVYGWLMTINSNRVKKESRPRVLAYQNEFDQAINDYATKGIAVNPRTVNPSIPDLSITDDLILKLAYQSSELIVPKILEQLIEALPDHRRFEQELSEIVQVTTKYPELRGWGAQQAQGLCEHYSPLSPDMPRLIKGVTRLTPEIFQRLYSGEGWCRDKMMLWFWNDITTVESFDTYREEFNVPERRPQPMEIWMARAMTRDYYGFHLLPDQIVDRYNQPREVILQVMNQVWVNLNKVFAQTHVYVGWGAENYKFYMNIPQWVEKSDAFRKVFNLCNECGSQAELEVHHHTYVRKGHENPEDLVTLCKTCHGRRHPSKG